MYTSINTSISSRFSRVILSLAFLFVTCQPAVATPDQDTLSSMRADRRAAMQTLNRSGDKDAGPALFGLLVIPVDFSDARLPADWDPNDLTQRLTASSGESLWQYYEMASLGSLDLRVTQTTVVHLPGTRRDYSDVGYNGFTRTRALATQSLEKIRELGLEFRRLDMDGPDRIPGTDDDDGVIDGVLILHAGIGQENDPVNGLVQALQFFLEEPVVSQGVGGTFYAVASLHSGPGIWAHETGHLLGLEDRYDPSLRPSGGSEVLSHGGLGRFSLMASGAWGTGDGYGAALPDAYSSLQMGWYQEKDLTLSFGSVDTLLTSTSSGQAGRLWTQGQRGPEFFLVETRDPETAYPFDADIPGRDLIIYHIDENLPEGQGAEDDNGQRYLRASVVEADDDFHLRDGEDTGRAEDLFPGPLDKSSFTPWTVPSSDGYNGYSGVELAGLTVVDGGVAFQATGWAEPTLEFESGFSGGDEMSLELVARSGGVPLGSLNCLVTVSSSPSWGTFTGGQLSVAIDFADDGSGVWRPVQPVPWFPDDAIPSDARTSFTYDFTYEDGVDSERRTWYWQSNGDVLDFGADWPGQWGISGSGNIDTFWWRWDTGPWLTADQTPILACTGFEFSDSGTWPAVNYQNRADIKLTSGPLGPEITGVRLVHAMEAEYLTEDVVMDGGTVVWVDGQGMEHAAEPLAGWRGVVADQAVNVLHGQGVLVEKELELEGDIPLWRTDIIPVPENFPGPWQLRLKFGSNTLWRYRGWFVASVDPLGSDPTDSAFEGVWLENGSGLAWNWPWPTGAGQRFIVQQRSVVDGSWATIADEIMIPAEVPGDFFMPAEKILPYLEGSDRQRHEVRVLGFIDKGKVATRNIVVFPDGGDGQTIILGLPWPNPALGSVRIMADIPPGEEGRLGIYDLRGRLVQDRTVGAGSHLLEWDGRGSHGARAAAGTYIIRLEGSGSAVTRKVVLLH